MGVTQQQIYAGLDLDLSWSERDLPERVRTKHVHRLHPYLGKFIPQLVEVLFAPARAGAAAACSTRLPAPARRSCRRSRADSTRPAWTSRRSTACSMRGQDRELQPVRPRARAARRVGALRRGRGDQTAGRGLRRGAGSRRRRAATCSRFRSLIDDYEHADVLRVVLARAARSARRTTHFDLDFPQEPQLDPYWCFKHRRECRPVERAEHFLRRYTLDTLARLEGVCTRP